MYLLAELKRRSVLRVAAGYVAVSWLAIQVVETLFPMFGLSEAAARGVVVGLAVGFIPALVLAWAFELTPEGFKRDANADRSAPGMQKLGKRLDRIIIAVLAVAVGFFGFDKFILDPARDVAREVAAEERGRTQALIGSYGTKSIAVMPFVNMSSDPEQEYFSDGISEELLNLLAQIQDLRVISRSSAFSFKGKDIELSEIADRLEVAHILEGSVRKSGNRIRITAQLIEAKTDTHLWSQTYDRELEDIFDIQDEIAAAVVDGIEVELLGAPPPTTDRIDIEAYTLYLRGEQFLEFGRGRMKYEEALQLAIPLFEQALEIEPDFIDGWLDLAKANIRLSNYLPGEQDAAIIAQYYEALEKARRIDENHPVVLAWQASNDFYEGGDTQAVATRYEKAIEAAPTTADVMLPARLFVMSIGRVDKALAMAELAVDRDPKCGDCWYILSQILRDIGRHGEAVSAAEVATALGMEIEFSIAKTRLYQHDPDGMLALFDNGNLDHWTSLWGYSLGLYTAGRMAEFEDVFAELRDDWGEGVPLDVAMVYAWSGNLDAAFEWLRRTMELNVYELQIEYRSPFLFNLHGDPRWEEILRKIERHPEQLAKIEFDPEIPAVNR